MKKLLLSLSFLLIIVSVRAQAPQGINYQGVARDAFGNAISKQAISVQLQLHQGSSGGSVAFSEVHTVTTDTFGLYNFVIGSANQPGFNSINWSTGNFWLEVDIDPTGTSTAFVPVSTSQLMSVPFALYAGNSGSGTVTSLTGGTGIDASPSTITTTGTFSLAPSGVTPGTFGTATQIPVITVDAMGRVTGISTQTVAASTTSITTAGGGITSTSLSNSYTLSVDNTIAQWNASQIQSVPVAVSGLSNGQILQYNGSNWVNTNPPASASITTNGGGITSNTSGNSYTLTVDNTIPQWNASQILNTPVSLGSLSAGQTLQYNGSNWVNINPPPPLPSSSGGEVLYSNGGTWSPSNPAYLYFNGNFLGIGNNAPSALLDVKSTNTTPAIMATNTGTGPAIVSYGPLRLGSTLLDLNNTTGSAGDILVSQGSSAGPVWTNPSAFSNWTTVGNGIFPTTTTLNVGVGTGSPNYQLDVVNSSTVSTAVNIANNGQGHALDIQNNYSGAGGSAINVTQYGTGSVVYISGQNVSNTADVLYVETKGPGNAIKGYTDAAANAIIGYYHGTNSGYAGIYGLADNIGSAAIFRSMNSGNSDAALDVMTTGTGFSGTFSGGAGLKTDKIQITGGAAANYVLTSDGVGNASWQPASGGGLPSGALGQILYNDGTNWVGSSAPNLFFSGTQLGIGTNAPSAGIDVQGGPGVAGNFVNAGNSAAINAQNSGVGPAINATNAGTGSAGVFQNTNGSNNQPVLSVVNSPANPGKSAIFSGGSGVQIDNLQVQTNLNIPLNSNPGFVLTSDAAGNATWQAPAGGVTSVSATAPLTSTGGTNPSIGITQASGTSDGYLSLADWNTFNNKLSTVAVSGPITGNGTGGTPLGLALNNGFIFVGNGSNLAAPVSMTGDVNISNAGLTNLSPTGVTPGSYGNPTSIPQISVDAKGRITSAGTVAITGTLPAGTNGQMLFNNGGAWVPSNPNSLFYAGTNMGINNSAPVAAFDAVSTTTVTAIKGTNLSGGVAVFANGPLKLGSHIVDGAANPGATGDVLVSQSAGTAPRWMNPSTITAAGGAWVTSGNSVSASDFIGTTNPSDLVFKTNNAEHMRIDQTGLVSIGTGAPSTGPTLEVFSTGIAPTIKGINNGSSGPAGTFTISNASNSSNVLTVSTVGNGPGITVTTVGGNGINATTSGNSGNAANFQNTSAGNNNPVVNVTAVGAGPGVNINASGSGAAIEAVTTSSSGQAGYFNLNNSSSNNNALMASSNSSAGATIYANNTNGGGAADFEILSATNNSPVLTALTNGAGIGASISVSNASNGNYALSVAHNGSGTGIFSNQSGTGPAGYFQVSNAASNANGLTSIMSGKGNAGFFQGTNTGDVVNSISTGTGRAGNFSINNSGNTTDAVYVFTNGSGNALTSYASGAGYAIYGNNNNASSGSAAGFFNSNGSNAVSVQNSGTGNAIGAAVTGSSGNAGFFQVSNAGNSGSAVLAITSGPGSAITSQNTGSGYSGTFVGGAGFKVDGMQMNLRIATNGINTLTSTDYFLLIPTGTAGSITLPSASVAGKVFIIKNLSPSSFTISPSYTSLTGLTNQTTVAGTTVLHLVSDGSTWQAW